ncbi:ABC transporter substrate-binding protein [Paenibacillus nasutitermitis]|uniref:Sugar ABC transporter substrate-binding protein n=1 Tax=Paenibacillus nasutitermitis TaxID=1652958 RepID=A0A916ZD76_9BACL|nr:sugar ABC transporter substrate-binding protein [Paenibacillus nasutitermitis]GGD89326.1 sugar ABC transporter substrate-binding protein [Paenibacillus nasutitermitis]
MKKAIHTALALIIAFSLSACSSSNGNGDNNKGDTEAASAIKEGTVKPSETSTDVKDVKLKIGLPGGYDITKKEIIDGFIAKYPHIKLEIDESPWTDFVTKITAQIAGGNPPDVWLQENAAVLGYGKRGVAEDLTPYIERDLKLDDYNQALLSSKSTDGKVYGIPHGLNPVALAYNKKVFADANVPLPTADWTYQDMIDTAKKLTRDTNGDGKPDVYGLAVASNITVGWFPWSRAAGGAVLDAAKTKATVTDPKTVEGLKLWVSVIKDGTAPTLDVMKAGGGDHQMFGNNQLGMYFLQYNRQVGLNDNYPDLDWDTVVMPKGLDGKRVVPVVTNSWVVYSRASQEVKDAAWEFLKYYLGEESQAVLAASGVSLPVKKSAEAKLDNTKKPLNKKAYVDGVAEAGMTLDENPSWNEWRSAAQPVFEEIISLTKPVEDAVKEIQDKIQAVLDENQ